VKYVNEPKGQIRITCDTKLHVDYTELHEIQGSLKTMTKENFAKLRREILDNGFNFPVLVWRETAPAPKAKSKSESKRLAVQIKGTVSKYWIIDGHGKHSVVKYLVEEEGMTVGKLPCVEVEATSLADAKRKVLAASSSYNTMTNDGLREFMESAGLSIEQLEAFSLAEIDFEEFKMEHFGEPAAAPAGAEGEGKQVSFDSYQNASIKQVVLYYAKDDYTKVITRLDELVATFGVEDYSQVVWRLLGEKV
jgi:hypothetical protein